MKMRKLQLTRWRFLIIWIPLGILVVYVFFFGLDIPFGDPWATVLPHIIKFYQGNLTFSDLLSQNNEHRPFFPRLIFIPLAVLTRWNTRAEMGIQIGFSIATFLIVKQQLSFSWRKLSAPPSDWVLLIISMLVFSLNQWENWLNGYQLLFSSFAFASVSALFLLANPYLSVKRFILGILCTIIAQYTISAGVIIWGVGLILLLITTKGKGRKILFVSIWITVMSVSNIFYFKDFHFSSNVSLDVVLTHPYLYLLYIFTFLGSPVMTFYTASILGIAGMGLLVFIVIDIWRQHANEELMIYLPYLALSGFSFLVAILIGLGRLGEKWWLALSPRYVGFSVWFWVGIVCVLSLKIVFTSHVDYPSQLDMFWRKYTRYILGTILVLSIIGSTIGFGLGIYLRYLPLRSARTALINGNKSDETLVQIYPTNVDYLRQQLPLLEKYHLSIYR